MTTESGNHLLTESGNHLLTDSGIQLHTEQGNQLHTEQSNQLYTESGIQFATVSSEPSSEDYGSPRYSMMIRTCLAVRSFLCFRGMPISLRAATRSGQFSIQRRRLRTAWSGVLSGKYIIAKSLRFILCWKLNVESWKLKEILRDRRVRCVRYVGYIY